MTDTEIINIILKGNRDKFRMLVEKYQSMIFRTCMGFLHDKDDADDLTQEVFIKTYQSLNSFKGDSAFSTWIYRIAVNKSLNLVKKRKRETFYHNISSIFGSGENENKQSNVDPFSPNEADKDLKNKELHGELKNAINSLPENQKIAFILNKYQDLSYKEVAEVMEISLSSVESLIFRAKSNLQKLLSNYYKKNIN